MRQAYPAGSLTLQDVKNTLFDWVFARTQGLLKEHQILWRNQSEPLPERPCVTLRVTSGPRAVGYSDGIVFTGGESGSEYLVAGQRVMDVSVQIFGSSKVKKPTALQLALDLNSSLYLPSVLDLLRQGGVSILDQGDPSNLTALEETEFEERAQFDVSLSLAQNVVDDPGIITQVGPITSTINK